MTTWNPLDKAVSITLSNGNLTATSSSANSGVRGTTSNSSGKWYFEFTATNVVGNTYRTGLANSGANLTTALGGNSNGVGYQSNTGAVNIGGLSVGTAAIYTTGNTIGVAVDFTGKLIWFAINGGNWNNSALANPATGTGGFSLSSLSSGPYFIAFYGNVNLNACTMAPAGGSFTPPIGFTPWDATPETATLAANGTATVAFIGQAETRGALIANGSALTSFSAQSEVRGVLAANGSSSTAFVGQTETRASLTANGSSSVAFTGRSETQTSLIANGASSTSFAGAAAIKAALTANGTSVSSFTAQALATTSLTAIGTCVTAFGAPVYSQGVLIANGTCVTSFVGQSAVVTQVSPDPFRTVIVANRNNAAVSPWRQRANLIATPSRAIVAQDGIRTMLSVDPKNPDETPTVAWAFTDLADGVTVSSAIVTAEVASFSKVQDGNPSAILNGGSSINTGGPVIVKINDEWIIVSESLAVMQPLEGGNVGVIYALKCKATLSTGEIVVSYMSIAIVQYSN